VRKKEKGKIMMKYLKGWPTGKLDTKLEKEGNKMSY